jgi:hypothetical protein
MREYALPSRSEAAEGHAEHLDPIRLLRARLAAEKAAVQRRSPVLSVTLDVRVADAEAEVQ